MLSIEDTFARGIAGISHGFDSSILGQASSIDRLQQSGVQAAGGGGRATSLSGSRPLSLEQAIALVNRDPSLIPAALQALQDPSTFVRVVRGLAQKPQLIRYLPPEIFGFIQGVLGGGR